MPKSDENNTENIAKLTYEQMLAASNKFSNQSPVERLSKLDWVPYTDQNNHFTISARIETKYSKPYIKH